MYGAGPPPPLSKRIFSKYDTDKSGHINTSEFGSLCYEMGHKLTQTEISVAVKQLDHNGDGSITYDEFQKWWANDDRFKNLQLDDAKLEKINKATDFFRKFDADNSGTISDAELAALYKDLVALGVTDKPFDNIKANLDKDNNGSVSFNEYIDYLVANGKF
eukprot:TRINITY_DN3102_c0_g1_i1.p1 TRINITY_DN3102_c0_g1~~TRINITY_DN3102_c0_g1_i1.p1  ORF type:complete len:161 (-),score=46.38 TRINITY_DN3102_c0_g1_i1:148-630(-)